MQWFQFQISADGSSLALANFGRVFDPDAQTDSPWWYYFPSLMVNCAGDMVAAFSGSTKTNYIGAFYTARIAGATTNQPPTLFQAGTTATTPRWGDYSATSLDPTDDWSFWTVQEYATGSDVHSWGTVIAKIRPNP